ncbi:hypothetical protein [Alicyclobacillus sacchari]|uniref:hypothetical protein n=1 Tax=Alicyclobacillus sacchari TaxID=392010 RepID=UPI0024E0FAB2|nr:hypothetical protein [Alicyclobacillus sacchari]
MERAFAVHEHKYQEGSRDFFASSQAATLPAPIAGYVSGVVGLDEEPMTGHLTVTKRSAAASGGYTPDRFKARTITSGSIRRGPGEDKRLPS